jgi:hypothetical protein
MADKIGRTGAENSETKTSLEIYLKSGKGSAAQIKIAEEALAKVKRK